MERKIFKKILLLTTLSLASRGFDQVILNVNRFIFFVGTDGDIKFLDVCENKESVAWVSQVSQVSKI